MRSPQLLRELDNVAVRVTNVKGSFTPWSGHRPSQYFYTEPFQPLRFRVDIIDDEADLTAWRLAGFATNETLAASSVQKAKTWCCPSRTPRSHRPRSANNILIGIAGYLTQHRRGESACRSIASVISCKPMRLGRRWHSDQLRKHPAPIGRIPAAAISRASRNGDTARSGIPRRDPRFGSRVRSERDDPRAATRFERGVAIADESVVPINRRYRTDVTAS